MQSYRRFLRTKLARAQADGFEPTELSPVLFDWQADIVRWACRQGRAALFEECGLGKTIQQLEWARQVTQHTGGRVLILAPLAVVHQTHVEARDKLELDVEVSRDGKAQGSIVITNYDRLDHFDADDFRGVVLDESSVLKAYSGQTKKKLLQRFDRTPYRLACTATPAPNDHIELGNHAEFLGTMTSHEMLTRWFLNDTMKAGGYRLKGHAVDDFWRWVSTWAACIGKPSDLGYKDDGFDLPPLDVEAVRVEVNDELEPREGELFAVNDKASATRLWERKRLTKEPRCNAAAKLIREHPDDFSVVWCDSNDEADYLQELLPDAIEVRGSDKPEEKARKLGLFSDGAARVIITKPDIAAFGLNWQHASVQVFAGFTFSFEKQYQAIRRSWRFGQKKPVKVSLFYSHGESNVRAAIVRKMELHQTMSEKMREATQQKGLGGKKVTLPGAGQRVAGGGDEPWELRTGDAVERIKEVEDDSVALTIFSPPFANLYTYSPSERDMGNCVDAEEFFQHFDFLVPQLLRVTRPGRLCVVHCKELPRYMNRDGAAGIYDFPGHLVRSFEGAGWQFHSRVTIWKDPVIEAQRTNNYGLLHGSFAKRTEVCRVGLPDVLVVFRRWAEDMDVGQVTQERQPGDYIGTAPPAETDQRAYSIAVWQRYASPVWFDVDQTDVLNARQARENEDEKHICPLQLGVIRRCVDLWSMPGETVFSPFTGIGSEGYVALQMGRRFSGIELKEAYAEHAEGYLRSVADQGSLFAIGGSNA